MRSHVVRSLAVLAAVAGLSTAAQAQRKVVTSSSQASSQSSSQKTYEFGIDGAIFSQNEHQDVGNGTTVSQRYTNIQLPVTQFRVGYFTSPTIEWEPALMIQRQSTDGASGTQMDLDVGMLYHFSPSRAQKQWYVRPFVGFAYGSSSQDFNGTTVSTSGSAMKFGVGGGLKLPLMDRLGSRFEARYAKQMTNDKMNGYDGFGIAFGLSYYTR